MSKVDITWRKEENRISNRLLIIKCKKIDLQEEENLLLHEIIQDEEEEN